MISITIARKEGVSKEVVLVKNTTNRTLFGMESGNAVEELNEWLSLVGVDFNSIFFRRENLFGVLVKDAYVEHDIKLYFYKSINTDIIPTMKEVIVERKVVEDGKEVVKNTIAYIGKFYGLTNIYLPKLDSEAFESSHKEALDKEGKLPVLKLGLEDTSIDVEFEQRVRENY
ncbi:hypothetical protein [Bacillus toyonensis]|uniref:hypothetical protein n=1 Tax=Bacillus toyonensis TaxID=155322 RepID=UPI000BF8DED2|nr:hypothetical protein [Bacillus toyonensis]PGF04959.1 hypothetical protein COM61_00525 [Bacillus toyonensis]